MLGILIVATRIVTIAVGRARDDARRSQCTNKLKQIGLALHNYHSTYNCFPPAALPNDRLPPEKRLSWQLGVIPFMFCFHCWGLDELAATDYSRPWDVDANRRLADLPLEPLLCPDSPHQPPHGTYSGFHPIARSRLNEMVPTTYVGIAGIGKDAASLLKGDSKAGVFGYDRVTRVEDIRDGTSTTMIVAETSRLQGPWTSGGAATVRGLDPARLPYIGKGRQFGGNHPGGAQVLCADGSVHFVRDTIAPKVFEALATIAGGERLPVDWNP